MVNKFEWNEEHQAYLEQLIGEKLSAAGVAQRMNARFGSHLTRNAIMGRVHRTGLQFFYTFLRKPTGRPSTPVRARMPRSEMPKRMPPSRAPKLAAPMPTYRAPSGNGIHPDAHSWDYCQCILDDGMRCDGERVPGSSWCEYHREKFTVPTERQLRQRRY